MLINRPADIAPYIDHTALKPTVTAADIRTLCAEAQQYGFASVCVNPYFVPLAHEILGGTQPGPGVCTVVGFPLGATTTAAKTAEARQAVVDGAREVDMVMNLSAFKSGAMDHVLADIESVVRAVPDQVCVKVILEICYLTPAEIRRAARLALRAGADFVKTSTGFGSGGATLDAVRIMAATIGGRLGIKAAGGIADYQTAKDMIANGATRIGASAGVDIVTA